MEQATKQRKATMATVKSFIRKNRAALLVRVESSFDGMTDCVQDTGKDTFTPARDSDRPFKNNMGIAGLWVVGGSRDYIQPFQANGLRGFNVSNCCGSFSIAIAA